MTELEPQPEQPQNLLEATADWVADHRPLDESTKQRLSGVSTDTNVKLRFFANVFAERKTRDIVGLLGITDRVFEALFSPASIMSATTKELLMMADFLERKTREDAKYVRKVSEKSSLGAGAEGVLSRQESQAPSASIEEAKAIPAGRRDQLRQAFEKLMSLAQNATEPN